MNKNLAMHLVESEIGGAQRLSMSDYYRKLAEVAAKEKKCLMFDIYISAAKMIEDDESILGHILFKPMPEIDRHDLENTIIDFYQENGFFETEANGNYLCFINDPWEVRVIISTYHPDYLLTVRKFAYENGQ